MARRADHVSRGVTLVEVIFSIGVILIGLLGLLSILPLAGRRSQDAIDLSVASLMSDSVLDSLLANRFLGSDRLVQLGATAAIDGTTEFCIDPLLASGDGYVTSGDYDSSVFPYFVRTHSPLTDPSVPTASAIWPSLPRMLRVGIPSNIAAAPLDEEQARRVTENIDDLDYRRPDDRSKPSVLNSLQAIAGGLQYGKRVPTGDFTWIATVDPLPDGEYVTVTVVVMRERDRGFGPPSDPSPGTTSAQDNLSSERSAYVTYASGFSGGAGGIVHLVSSVNTDSKILANDWVMLSRILDDQGDADPTNDDAIHRWYRVVAAPDEAEVFELADTDSDGADDNLGAHLPSFTEAVDGVWRQKVLLDGPDWAFQFENVSSTPPPLFQSYGDDSFDDNTYATIVKDVVAVSERTVPISDL